MEEIFIMQISLVQSCERKWNTDLHMSTTSEIDGGVLKLALQKEYHLYGEKKCCGKYATLVAWTFFGLKSDEWALHSETYAWDP